MADLLVEMTVSGLPRDLFATKSIVDVDMKAFNQKQQPCNKVECIFWRKLGVQEELKLMDYFSRIPNSGTQSF